MKKRRKREIQKREEYKKVFIEEKQRKKIKKIKETKQEKLEQREK